MSCWLYGYPIHFQDIEVHLLLVSNFFPAKAFIRKNSEPPQKYGQWALLDNVNIEVPFSSIIIPIILTPFCIIRTNVQSTVTLFISKHPFQVKVLSENDSSCLLDRQDNKHGCLKPTYSRFKRMPSSSPGCAYARHQRHPLNWQDNSPFMSHPILLLYRPLVWIQKGSVQHT